MIPEEEARQIAGRIVVPGLSRPQVEGVRLQIVNAICRATIEERRRWTKALSQEGDSPHHPAQLIARVLASAIATEREACAQAADEVERRQQADHGAVNTSGAAQAAAAIRGRPPG